MKPRLIMLLPALAISLLPTGTMAADPVRNGTLIREARMDLMADGKAIGFARVPAGTRVTVVSEDGEGVMVRRNSADRPFLVPRDSLTIETPAPESTPPTETTAPAPTTAPTPSATATPAPSPSATSLRISGNTATLIPSPAEVNKALGIPLFGTGSLWDENDAVVANRLRWPQESKTSSEAGYRRYPYTFNSETKVLGARALSLFLQGVNDRPARVAILFANKGDVVFYSSAQEASRQAAATNQPLNVTDGMLKGCQDAMRRDKATLEAALKALFGDSRPVRTGRFATTAEEGLRWDWNGHTFLLAAPQNEYVALRIIPTSVFEDADSGKKAFAAAKAELSKRVQHREGGDVIITDLPMVDQGRKGYCVPATFERILRYYGLAEDMNVLAMAGKTEAGGGTSVSDIQAATYAMIRDAGGNITQRNFTGSVAEIKPFIEAGKPILFAHYSTREFNKRVNDRMTHRIAVNNWDEWKNTFLPSLKKTIPLQADPLSGHVCLIVGYNEKTREIAISDSWGQAATERWMTEEEARQIKATQALSVIE